MHDPLESQNHCLTNALHHIIGTILVASLLITGCSGATDTTKAPGLHVQDAYIKRAVPGRKMTAAYATLINGLPDTLCFVGFEANFATRIELHVTEPVGGPNSERVAMRRLHEQCLGAGEQLVLAPGGKHLMIMNLDDEALSTATTATIRLGTKDGRLFAAEFAVVPFNYSPQNL